MKHICEDLANFNLNKMFLHNFMCYIMYGCACSTSGACYSVVAVSCRMVSYKKPQNA